jgi:hypothetical protein
VWGCLKCPNAKRFLDTYISVCRFLYSKYKYIFDEDFIECIIGFGIPAFKSLRNVIEERNEDKKWTTYWIVFAYL